MSMMWLKFDKLTVMISDMTASADYTDWSRRQRPNQISDMTATAGTRIQRIHNPITGDVGTPKPNICHDHNGRHADSADPQSDYT